MRVRKRMGITRELEKAVMRELQYKYGIVAATNLFLVLYGEINRFVGTDGTQITAYCAARGLIETE